MFSFKVPIMPFFLFFHLILYITQWTSAKKLIWMKCNFFSFTSLENVQICHHFGPPFAPVFPWFGMSCELEIIRGRRDFRLDSSHLFYHCKCILYGLQSEIYWGKTSERSQAQSHTFLNLYQSSEHVDLVMSGKGLLQENICSIFRFLKIHKK